MKKVDKEKYFSKIIKDNKSIIYMICRAYTENEDEANDCFQEVTIKLWKGIDSFKNKSSISTWIYRVSLNTCISYSRDNAKLLNTESIITDIEGFVETEKNDNIDNLYALIRQLNKYDRALVLLWLENLSYCEIADIMGLTVNNVSVKLVRIKEKLKSLNKKI